MMDEQTSEEHNEDRDRRRCIAWEFMRHHDHSDRDQTPCTPLTILRKAPPGLDYGANNVRRRCASQQIPRCRLPQCGYVSLTRAVMHARACAFSIGLSPTLFLPLNLYHCLASHSVSEQPPPLPHRQVPTRWRRRLLSTRRFSPL